MLRTSIWERPCALCRRDGDMVLKRIGRGARVTEEDPTVKEWADGRRLIKKNSKRWAYPLWKEKYVIWKRAWR